MTVVSIGIEADVSGIIGTGGTLGIVVGDGDTHGFGSLDLSAGAQAGASGGLEIGIFSGLAAFGGLATGFEIGAAVDIGGFELGFYWVGDTIGADEEFAGVTIVPQAGLSIEFKMLMAHTWVFPLSDPRPSPPAPVSINPG